MPARKKQVPVAAPPDGVRQPYFLESDAPWGGFINIRLSDQQKEEFHAWQEDNHEFSARYFDEMLGSGIKASFSYDAHNECYVLAVTGALVLDIASSRFCSTSRAGSMAEVVDLTVWKHDVLARGNYGNYKPKTGAFLSWG